MPWGRSLLTPGRLVTLIGLLAGVIGLYFPSLGSGSGTGASQWALLGSVPRGLVMAGTAVLIASAFRPGRPRRLDVAGALVLVLLGGGAMWLAADRLSAAADAARVAGGSRGVGPLVVAAGAVVLAAGAGWDLVATLRAAPAAASGTGGETPEGAAVTGEEPGKEAPVAATVGDGAVSSG